MVKAYLDAISERKGILDSAPRKLLKAVALASVGMGVGTLAAEYAGAAAGAASGIAAAAAVEKIAEFTTETALGLLDTFVLERVTKGWSPRMFFDDLSSFAKCQEKFLILFSRRPSRVTAGLRCFAEHLSGYSYIAGLCLLIPLMRCYHA